MNSPPAAINYITGVNDIMLQIGRFFSSLITPKQQFVVAVRLYNICYTGWSICFIMVGSGIILLLIAVQCHPERSPKYFINTMVCQLVLCWTDESPHITNNSADSARSASSQSAYRASSNGSKFFLFAWILSKLACLSMLSILWLANTVFWRISSIHKYISFPGTGTNEVNPG